MKNKCHEFTNVLIIHFAANNTVKVSFAKNKSNEK